MLKLKTSGFAFDDVFSHAGAAPVAAANASTFVLPPAFFAPASAQAVVANRAPVLTVVDRSVAANATIQASSLIQAVSDPDGNIVTSYRFFDNNSTGGYFTLNGVKQASGSYIVVSADNLKNLLYVGGATAGAESVLVGASDGALWSNVYAVNITTTASASSATSAPTTSTTTTAKTTTVTPTTLPAWVAQLTDAGVKADVTAALADKTVSYSEMLKILTDVEASGVSAGEFNDLKALVSNWSNGITMSTYVHDVANKLVNGDAANASWNGGSATKTALGNLAAGSSAAQMDKLIQKWFLGGDLPDSTDDNGSVHSYAKSSAPLFGAGGPNVRDVNQGYLGDCYLLSTLADVAVCEPSVLTAMFKDNGNSTWGVRFYIGGKENWVTVNNAVPTGFNSSSALWSTLVEKAYAQLNSSGVLPRSAGDSYRAIEGGFADPITEITGRSVSYYYALNYSSSGWGNLKTTFVNAINSKQEIWIGSYNNLSAKGEATFYSGHAYSVVGYDTGTGNFIVRNPWGREAAADNASHFIQSSYGYYWTQFEASMTDLFNDKAYIGVAGAVGAGLTPTVAAVGQAGSLGLSLDAFGGSLALADSMGLGVANGAAALLNVQDAASNAKNSLAGTLG